MADEAKTSEQSAIVDAAGAPVSAPPKRPRKKATKKKAAKKKRSRSTRSRKKASTKKISRLTAEAILKKQDIKEEELFLEEWDGTVVVRALSSVAHEKLVQSSMEGPMGNRIFNMVGYQAKLAVLCSYDGFQHENGKRIFADAHVPMLMEKASGPISKIATKAQELSGLGGAALERLRANLGMTPSEGSPSA